MVAMVVRKRLDSKDALLLPDPSIFSTGTYHLLGLRINHFAHAVDRTVL